MKRSIPTLIASIIMAVVCAMSILGYTKFNINLGIDLKGGASVMAQVDMDEIFLHEINLKSESLKSMKIDNSIIINQDNKKYSIKINNKDLRDQKYNIYNLFNGYDIKEELDHLILSLSDMKKADLVSNVINISIFKIRQRVDSIGVTESVVRSVGLDGIIIETPGVYNTQQLKDIIGKTGRLEFYIASNKLETGFIRSNDQYKSSYISKTPYITGESLKSSKIGRDTNGMPAVVLEFDANGSSKLAEITRKYIGRSMIIKLDNQTITSGLIKESILGGNAQISGVGDFQEAKKIVAMLNAGALPATIHINGESYVMPTIGEATMNKLYLLIFICAIIIMIYISLQYTYKVIPMIFFSVGFMLLTTLFIMSLLSVTLTLYGMAALVVILGMAVDSNIICIEEYYKNGVIEFLNKKEATEKWNDVFSTITSSNITTLMVGIMLTIFGYGPIQGFGVTMTIGIAATLITFILPLRAYYRH